MNEAVRAFKKNAANATPLTESIRPNAKAPFADTRPEGSGLCRVRFIWKSIRLSIKQFSAPAPAADKKPATPSKRSELVVTT